MVDTLRVRIGKSFRPKSRAGNQVLGKKLEYVFTKDIESPDVTELALVIDYAITHSPFFGRKEEWVAIYWQERFWKATYLGQDCYQVGGQLPLSDSDRRDLMASMKKAMESFTS